MTCYLHLMLWLGVVRLEALASGQIGIGLLRLLSQGLQEADPHAIGAVFVSSFKDYFCLTGHLFLTQLIGDQQVRVYLLLIRAFHTVCDRFKAHIWKLSQRNFPLPSRRFKGRLRWWMNLRFVNFCSHLFVKKLIDSER